MFGSFVRRRFLVGAFIAIVGSLIGLFVLEYRWLSRLERMSLIAHDAQLTSYVDAVGREASEFYRDRASLLDLPDPGPVDDLKELLETRWQAAEGLEGIRRLFLMDFTRSPFGNLFFFDEEHGELYSPPASDESLAIILMSNPWQIGVYRGQPVMDRGLLVDERDPRNRMLLRLFVDEEEGALLAIVGMTLDEEWFVGSLLPRIVTRQVDEILPPYMRDRLTVSAGNASGWDVLWSGRRAEPGEPLEGDPEGADLKAFVPFVFTDWTISLSSAPFDAQRWARAGFGFSLSLAVILSLALLAGIVLALRAANRAVALSEMKSDFVSNVSHELRTPVASIRTLGELLKLGHADPAKVREYGEHIESESRRLSRLIDNILDFSRIESGRKQYRFRPSRLEPIVEATVRAFEVRTKDRGFEYVVELPEEPLPELSMDPDAVGQVLHNLLDNAVKYSGESRRIEVRAAAEDGGVSCTIVDHGVGIDPEEQARVFERFHRVGTGLVHDVKGSGLGLSIVQHVVAAHEGHVAVESRPGRGTAVTLHLPATRGGGDSA